jgi:hypothetical protein
LGLIAVDNQDGSFSGKPYSDLKVVVMGLDKLAMCRRFFTEFVALYSDVPTLCMLSNFWKRMERDVFEFVRMQTSGKMISKYERKCR